MQNTEDMIMQNEIEFSIRDLENRIDWTEMYGNSNPVEIEVGCGKGRFIINSAVAYPDINYIGIERSLPYFRFMKERSAKRDLTNIRVLQDDAGYFIEKFVRDHSISAYHIYFPDPWPKKRHRKRRIFQQPFLDHLIRTLISDGTIDIATDFAEYFEEMVDLLDASNRLQKLDNIPDRVTNLGEDRTNFEAKYVAEGRPIYRAGYKMK
jgi:tRNA (guanine-N7-)-methyltransferase